MSVAATRSPIESGGYNIAHGLHDQAQARPDHAAIFAQDLELTYANLWRLVRAYALNMHRNGVRRGDVVSVDTGDTIASVICTFATAYLGAVLIPFDPNLAQASTKVATHILRTADRPALAPNGQITQILILPEWSPRHTNLPDEDSFADGFAGPEDLCWIMPSSGTTARPKLSAVPCRLLQARLAGVAADYGTGETRLLQLFAPGSRPFLIRAVALLLSGNTLLDMRSKQDVDSSGVNFVCGSPNQLLNWLGENCLSPKIAVAQVSGARVGEHEARQLLKSFTSLEDVYGSNETIKAHVDLLAIDSEGQLTRRPKTPLRFVEIVGADGQPKPDGEEGRIRISSPYLVDSYLNDSTATQMHFRDGWFYPGDMGRFEANGALCVLGRRGDMVNIGGQKLFLADIDAALATAEGINRAAVFSNEILDTSERLLACVSLDPRVTPAQAEAIVEAAWLKCAREITPFAAPGKILAVADLPVTADGIVPRAAAAKIFHEAIQRGDRDYLDAALFSFAIKMDG